MSFVHVRLLSQSSFFRRPLYERSRTTYFPGLEELRNEPVSLPVEERIEATTLTKSYFEILAVLLNIPLKNLSFCSSFACRRLWTESATKGVDHCCFHKVIQNGYFEKVRSSHRKCFVKQGVFKDFAFFTGKNLCWCLSLIKLQVFRPVTLLKIGSGTGFFLQNPRNF